VLSPPPARARLRRAAVPVLSILAGLALWQLVIALFHPNQLAVVGPADIVRGAVELLRAGTLGPDIGLSLLQLAAGLLIAVVAGALAGLLLGTNRWLAGAVGPWVTALYTIPVIAVAPLVIVGLGIGSATKIAIVAASGSSRSPSTPRRARPRSPTARCGTSRGPSGPTGWRRSAS
jgi:ABC-type nitrate/sulfonate/bicarbonate transport system permease component